VCTAAVAALLAVSSERTLAQRIVLASEQVSCAVLDRTRELRLLGV
jgi:hypothetical protein